MLVNKNSHLKYLFLLLFFLNIKGEGIIGDDSVGVEIGVEVHVKEHPIIRICQSAWPIYLFPTEKIFISFDDLTLSFMHYNDKLRFNYVNPSLMIIAGFCAMYYGESFLKPGPAAIVIGFPHLFGNNKICFSVIKNHLYLFLGINTDYYLYGKTSTVFFRIKGRGEDCIWTCCCRSCCFKAVA